MRNCPIKNSKFENQIGIEGAIPYKRVLLVKLSAYISIVSHAGDNLTEILPGIIFY